MKISALWTLLLGVLALVVQMLQGEAFLDAAWAPIAILVIGLAVDLIKVLALKQVRGKLERALGFRPGERPENVPSLGRIFWLG